MKVHILPDGTVELEVANGEGHEALDLIEIMQARARQKMAIQRMEDDRIEKASEDSHLDKHQYRTWEYLCENDSVAGIHLSQLAKDFGLTNSAANQRLLVLVRLGYARRVKRGYYRAELKGDDD